MTQYTVLGQLKLLVELDEEEAREALPYCAAAMEQLLPRLKPRCIRNDPRLDRAAAADALCMLLQRRENGGGDGVASFKAGDIMVTRQGKDGKDRLDQARAERVAAFAEIAELLRDRGFQVRATRVK